MIQVHMMEFVEMVIQRKALEDQVEIQRVIGPDDGNAHKQSQLLERMLRHASVRALISPGHLTERDLLIPETSSPVTVGK